MSSRFSQEILDFFDESRNYQQFLDHHLSGLALVWNEEFAPHWRVYLRVDMQGVKSASLRLGRLLRNGFLFDGLSSFKRLALTGLSINRLDGCLTLSTSEGFRISDELANDISVAENGGYENLMQELLPRFVVMLLRGISNDLRFVFDGGKRDIPMANWVYSSEHVRVDLTGLLRMSARQADRFTDVTQVDEYIARQVFSLALILELNYYCNEHDGETTSIHGIREFGVECLSRLQNVSEVDCTLLPFTCSNLQDLLKSRSN